MTDEKPIVASGIENVEWLTIFDKIAAIRFYALEIEKVLINLVDTVDSDALLYLAEQFDLLGYKGWRLARNEQEQRDLIKRAIELHRFKGTPFSVKQAIISLGYANAIIQENISFRYDGSFKYDGSIDHGSSTWATFMVTFDLGNNKGVTPAQAQEHVELINEYKNVRSALVGINYKATMDDEFAVDDELNVTAELVSDP